MQVTHWEGRTGVPPVSWKGGQIKCLWPIHNRIVMAHTWPTHPERGVRWKGWKGPRGEVKRNLCGGGDRTRSFAVGACDRANRVGVQGSGAGTGGGSHLGPRRLAKGQVQLPGVALICFSCGVRPPLHSQLAVNWVIYWLDSPWRRREWKKARNKGLSSMTRYDGGV